jgi:hypothetical protein
LSYFHSCTIKIKTKKIPKGLPKPITYLDDLVPTRRDNYWVRSVRGETNVGDPFRVSVFRKSVFAFTQSIPQFDGLVT